MWTKAAGKRLRELRTKRKMTLRQLRDRSGVSIAALSKLETGYSQQPKYMTLQALAKVYRTKVSTLIFGV